MNKYKRIVLGYNTISKPKVFARFLNALPEGSEVRDIFSMGYIEAFELRVYNDNFSEVVNGMVPVSGMIKELENGKIAFLSDDLNFEF